MATRWARFARGWIAAIAATPVCASVHMAPARPVLDPVRLLLDLDVLLVRMRHRRPPVPVAP